MSTRRAVLAAVCSLLAAGTLPVGTQAQPAAVLPRPASLAAELAGALAHGQALVVLVSLQGCPYCHLVRQSYLAPLRAGGQPVVQVELAEAVPLLDPQGRPSTHQQLARALGVRVAPTVLFLGPGGREAAPRLEGVASADFYGAYLQERVDAANRSVAPR